METALQKLTKAEQWLGEAKTLDDLKQIHDIAVAAEAYAQAHRLGISAENHAMEVRLLAARRIGELVPVERRGGKEDRGSKIRTTDIAPQRLSDFRKLAKIPEPKFKEKIEGLQEKKEKITYNKLLSSPCNESPKHQKRDPTLLSQLKSLWLRSNERTRHEFLKWADEGPK